MEVSPIRAAVRHRGDRRAGSFGGA